MTINDRIEIADIDFDDWAEPGYRDNDGRFPVKSLVWVRYPRDDERDRAQWPWLKGIVMGQCEIDEWRIYVDETDLAIEDDDHDGVFWYPTCYRDASELCHRISDGGESA